MKIRYMVSLDVAAELGKALKNLQFAYILIPHTNISDLPRAWSARAAFIDCVCRHAGKTHAKKFHVFYKLGSHSFGVPKREGLHEPDPPSASLDRHDVRFSTSLGSRPKCPQRMT